MTTAVADKALLTAPERKKSPDAPKLVRVAREHGVGPFTQFRQVLDLRLKKTGLHPREYYDFELYDPRYSPTERAAFVGTQGSKALNEKLSPAELRQHANFMNDKVMLASYLGALGISATETQAVVDKRRRFGTLPVLRTTEEITHFLLNDAVYPIFAKPAMGSLSVGSALIDGVDTEGRSLRLANGESVDMAEFVAEVIADHAAKGFLFQTAVRQHPAMTEIAGPALGTIRTVTVTEEADTPRVLYVLWKIPAPRAMSDNFWQDGSMLAAIDMETGKITSVRKGTGLETDYIENHPVSGKPLVGFQMPHWEELKALAESAHALFPLSGVLGWDIGMSDKGPVIVECNDAPFHTLYQLASGEGLNNPRFKPVFDKIIERQVKRSKIVKRAAKKGK